MRITHDEAAFDPILRATPPPWCRRARWLCAYRQTAGPKVGRSSFSESLQRGPHEERQRSRVVAALEDCRDAGAEVGRATRELPEPVRGDVHPGNRVVDVGVEARGDKHQL